MTSIKIPDGRTGESKMEAIRSGAIWKEPDFLLDSVSKREYNM